MGDTYSKRCGNLLGMPTGFALALIAGGGAILATPLLIYLVGIRMCVHDARRQRFCRSATAMPFETISGSAAPLVFTIAGSTRRYLG
ncbi:hypothetical protein [Agrobacterium tumefaciens]|uniref:hypothetical protein n=1 Tax=Agrobacterium tumefaciens TaxID=358 RepID=UPI001571DC3F|nr:hypothetical protein [Agrobacterium tumefaciens]NSY51543.1 hypothetical protein [Agrobacterium tumefaciens]NTA46011.1 hypothetical protein [Agrobacterium tumefaciens]NTA80619.1 hypothetical protein [Agrobacterium tumefaciens]UXT85302.1 hypothetical protein FY131_28460 [Agrobacterium tumefaciens]WCK16979.1 hypothetical protein G6L41_025960 [Agrobacterium tumefaciens]